VAPPGQKELSKFTIPLRVGLLLGGSGTNEVKCDGDCSFETISGADYSHRLGARLTADFLFKAGSLIRLGPGLAYTPPTSIKNDGASVNTEIGSDMALDFIFEVAPRVGPGVWLVPRGEVGLTVLFPTGDLKNFLESQRQTCISAGASNCESLGDARPGLNAGLGFGALFAVSDTVRLRADLLGQIYVVNLFTYEGTSPFGGSTTVSRNVGGSRFFLLGGVEFM
jgi:hypothetical protein